MTWTSRELAKQKILRIACVFVAVLAVGMLLLSFCPGTEVYKDAANCAGRAFHELAAFELHRHVPCDERYQLVATHRVVDNPVALLAFLAVLLAPGLLVWSRMKIRFALAWALIDLATVWLVFLWTFNLGDWNVRTVELWPAELFGALLVALLATTIAILPLTCAVLALLNRPRRKRPIGLAPARIHRG